MGTDPLDLELDGHRLRVVCGDPDTATVLRSILSDHLTAEPAASSFFLEPPHDKQNLWMLLDRSGYILGRFRRPQDAVAVLLNHLSGFLAPPPGTIRFRLRGLLGDDSQIVAASWPVLTRPPVIERQLERAGYRVIDRLALDVLPDGRVQMASMPWDSPTEFSDVAGHTPSTDRAHEVRALMVPRCHDRAPTAAELVHLVASSVVGPSNDRSGCLSTAERLIPASVLQAPENDEAALLTVLRSPVPATGNSG